MDGDQRCLIKVKVTSSSVAAGFVNSKEHLNSEEFVGTVVVIWTNSDVDVLVVTVLLFSHWRDTSSTFASLGGQLI